MWLILATFGSSPMLFAHAVPDGADSQPATLYCSGVVSAAVCTALLFVSHNLLNLVAFWLILVTFDSSSMWAVRGPSEAFKEMQAVHRHDISRCKGMDTAR